MDTSKRHVFKSNASGLGVSMGAQIDTDIRGTVAYGKELRGEGQETQEIEIRNAGPWPVNLYIARGTEEEAR